MKRLAELSSYRVSLASGRKIIIHEKRIARPEALALTQGSKVRDKAIRGPRDPKPEE